MKRLAIVVVISLLAASGCGRHCIKIGGEYKGVDGSFEYCFDYQKSKKIGLPVLKGPGGEKYIFDDKLVKKINDMLGGKVKANAYVPPIEELLEKIRNWRK